MKKILAVLAVTFGMHSYSHAGLLLEPYMGYQVMVNSLTTGSSLLSLPLKLDAKGVGVGVRAGYSNMISFIGLDYSVASLYMTQTSGLISISSGTSLHSELGVTAGLSLPVIRPYVGYIVEDQLIASSSRFIGSGYKAGLGFSFLPMIKVNLEYHSVTYTKYKATSTVTMPDAATYDSASLSGVMLNVSVPL